MINNLNKHGPRSDLMQGDGLNRGSPPSCPVSNPYVIVIESPGRRRTLPGYGSLTTGLKDRRQRSKRSSGSLIVYGLPVMSQTGRPEYSPPYPTHQPVVTMKSASVKHNLIDVRGSLCAMQSAISCQLSENQKQRTKNSFWNKEQSSKSLMSKNQ